MFLRFKKLGEFLEISHFVTTREGGVSKGCFESMNLGIDTGDDPDFLHQNYEIFSGNAGFNLDELVLAHQNHTDNIVIIDERSKIGLMNPYEFTDGFLTNVKGIPLSVRFADCQGVLFFDPVRKVIGAVHCGWRGNTKNIIGKTVKKMTEHYGVDPKNLIVGVSASLGPCCADFSDPLTELPPEIHKFINGKKVDLWAISKDQLISAGVTEDNIEISAQCTVCNNKKYFSYRGGKKKTGHMAAVIYLN